MTELPETRQSLLIALGDRNESAWQQFLEVYDRAILRYCMALGLPESEALDATQSVYGALHQRISTWDSDPAQGSFRAWLFRVARNVTIDLLKARTKSALASGDSVHQQKLAQVCDHRGDPSGRQTGESNEASFDLEMQRALFEWACRQVEGEVRHSTWQAFFRTAVEGKKANQVASELGLPIGSVYTAKCRVMARIREHIVVWQRESELQETMGIRPPASTESSSS